MHLEETRYDRGGLASDEHGEYIRNAFSIYSKLLCNLNLNRIGKHNWNFGLITGYYVYTHVDGIFEWTFLQDGPDYHGSNKFDGDDKDFFKSFYFGFVSDFQFNFKKVRFLKPAIELSFYPNYANIAADYYIDNDIKANRNMIMGSIILGFGSKRLPMEIEKL